MTINQGLFPRFIFVCLIFLQLPSLIAQTRNTVYTPTVLNVESFESFTRLSDLAQKVMAHPRLYQYLNEELSGFRQVAPDVQTRFQLPTMSEGLSETQIMFLLQNNKDKWAVIEQYLKTVTEENATKNEKIAAFRKEMRALIKATFQDPAVVEKFIKLNSPAQPLSLQVAGEKLSFTDIQVFANREAYEDPNNPESRVIPADDLKSVVIDVIRSAKKSIYLNVFEFNLLDVAQELIAANNRGVKVHIGIDASTTELGPGNLEVRKAFEEQMKKSKSFKFTAVDSVGLNHQKIIVVDAGSKKARTLFSSGNFTQSCIGPEGDLVNIPKEQRSKKSKPNSNHMIVIEGAAPALVTQQELVKTIDKKYRGRDYRISGAYVFQGPKDPITGQPTEVALAFSPNGGLGEVNRDLTQRVFLASQKGEILAVHFAFSSPELVQTLEQRIIKMVKQNQGFGFRSLGDPPFAMQFWSGFLALSGLRFNKENGKYEINPDSELVKNLSASDLQRLQDQIRINPVEYGEFHEKLADGSNTKVTVKVHDKNFFNPTENWAIIGTSFNPSGSAESNQEQWVLVRDSTVIRRIHGVFEYAYQLLSNQRIRSVAENAEKRNRRNQSMMNLERGIISDKLVRENTGNKCLQIFKK